MSLRKYFRRMAGEQNCGRIDWWLHLKAPDKLGGPLNGQEFRRRVFQELHAAIGFGAIVETGTFRGSSTEWFAVTTGLPVFTVEAVERTFAFARLRLRRFGTQVQLELGDSRSFLRRLCQDPALPADHLFFYLDAHWEDDLPLREEVRCIFSRWPDAVAMIDDFQVPGTAYGFDDYGQGKALTVDYLAPVIRDLNLSVFFPAVDASAETGLRRGTAVLCQDDFVFEKIRPLSSLRLWTHDATASGETC